MSRPHLLDALRDRVLLCDGGMGSRVQALTLDTADGHSALARFRSNRFAGALMAAACFVVGAATQL